MKDREIEESKETKKWKRETRNKKEGGGKGRHRRTKEDERE